MLRLVFEAVERQKCGVTDPEVRQNRKTTFNTNVSFNVLF